MSILSSKPDGLGFYYGFVPRDCRRVDVREEGSVWYGYVGGEQVVTAPTKDEAERVAVKYIEDNPEVEE